MDPSQPKTEFSPGAIERDPPSLLRLQYTEKFSIIGIETGNRHSCARTSLLFRPSSPSLLPSCVDCPSLRKGETKNKKILGIFLDLNCSYTKKLLLEEFRSRESPSVVGARGKTKFRIAIGPGKGFDPVSPPSWVDVQFSEYERIDWSRVLSGQLRASSYCVRKGLSRKAQFAVHMTRRMVKNPVTCLRKAIPRTIVIDTWPAFETDSSAAVPSGVMPGVELSFRTSFKERLISCLADAKEAIREAEKRYQESNSSNGGKDGGVLMPPVWILKASTVNKGEGIHIVHCAEQILECVIETPDMREWVLQRYISNPLLLRGRKFHVRAYALAVSAVSVYLYDHALALCSGTKYEEDDAYITDREPLGHITNTAYQSIDPNFKEEDCVLRLHEEVPQILAENGSCRSLSEAMSRVDYILRDMREITGEVFAAYRGEFGVFAPLEGCFEHYGLDFLVDDEFNVTILEVNPGPDFGATGGRLQSIVSGLMGATIDVALLGKSEVGTGLKKVYEHQMRSGSNQKVNIKLK